MKSSLKIVACGIILAGSSTLFANVAPDCLTKQVVQDVLNGDGNLLKEFRKLGWFLQEFSNVTPIKAQLEVVAIKKVFDHGDVRRDCTYKLMPKIENQMGGIEDGEMKLVFLKSK